MCFSDLKTRSMIISFVGSLCQRVTSEKTEKIASTWLLVIVEITGINALKVHNPLWHLTIFLLKMCNCGLKECWLSSPLPQSNSNHEPSILSDTFLRTHRCWCKAYPLKNTLIIISSFNSTALCTCTLWLWKYSSCHTTKWSDYHRTHTAHLLSSLADIARTPLGYWKRFTLRYAIRIVMQ